MSNFWDSLNANKSKNNFNIKQFIQFYNENKNKDMNKELNDMIKSGKITQEELNQATNKAKGILQMLQSVGVIK